MINVEKWIKENQVAGWQCVDGYFIPVSKIQELLDGFALPPGSDYESDEGTTTESR